MPVEKRTNSSAAAAQVGAFLHTHRRETGYFRPEQVVYDKLLRLMAKGLRANSFLWSSHLFRVAWCVLFLFGLLFALSNLVHRRETGRTLPLAGERAESNLPRNA
jgi:hypothetical protein